MSQCVPVYSCGVQFYLLLGTLQSASVDVRDVNIRFGASMEEIAAAWATGRADAAWCADS